MANTHKVSPERFRHLSHRIRIATKLQDWQTLQRLDSDLRTLLQSHKSVLKDPRLEQQIAEVKATHKAALEALQKATAELELQMTTVSAQREGTIAYQLAMTMEE